MTGQPQRSGGSRPNAGAKPGTSGGPRPGAGRPPQSWRLRDGDVFAAWIGEAFGNVATVSITSRNVMYLRLDDGTMIKLVR